jgi:tripartite ATP-independent transporter DctM subunit
MASAIMMLVFLFLLAIRIPVCASMGVGALVGLEIMDLPPETMIRYMLEKLRSIPILAVPFFILAASIMKEMNLVRKIFDFSNHIVGSLKGGLAQVNILASMIFAGISGSALADIGGLGKIQITAMSAKGYRLGFSSAITVASSVIGPIIPPSIMFIIYAVNARVSIAKLFIAGLLPGLFIGGALMVTVYILAKKGIEKCPETSRSSFKDIIYSFIVGLPAIITPIIILLGMTTGIFTPTEAAVVAVLYSILISFFYREFTFKRFYLSFVDTIKTTAMVMYLTGIGAVISFILTSEQVGEQLTLFLITLSDIPGVIFLLINLSILILGCILETLPALLIAIPVFVPLVINLGMDPLQFGVILTLNLLIGMMTPPIGIGLFAICAVSGITLEEAIKSTAVFLPTLLVVLLIITFFPVFTMWLPSILFTF